MLGWVGFRRKFILDFGTYQLLKREKQFQWTEKCEEALQELERKLLLPHVLSYRNYCDENALTAYAWLIGIVASLTQLQEMDRVLAHANRDLTRSGRNYPATKGDFFAVVFFPNHFKTYLKRQKFVIVQTTEPYCGCIVSRILKVWLQVGFKNWHSLILEEQITQEIIYLTRSLCHAFKLKIEA